MSEPIDMNRFQRWYFAWAAPYYARMSPTTRSAAIRFDRFLYSRSGCMAGLALLAFTGLSTAALAGVGVPAKVAFACSVVLWVSLPFAMVGAWLQPQRFAPGKLARGLLWVFCLGTLGAISGFLVGRIERYGSIELDTLPQALADAALRSAPILAVALLALSLLLSAVAHIRRGHLALELAQALAEAERDAARAQASEARLHVLQAQIQPHFLFNTLAALQHWVDTGDPRAAGLLQQLTAFLRDSTEQLGRTSAPLRDEAETARRYLAIMEARLGERLAFQIGIEAACEAQPLPPGLLMSLVENAVEHGIEPALHGGQIVVSAHADGSAFELRVSDDGVGPPAEPVEGVGLANSRARLRHLFGERASLRIGARSGGGAEVVVRVEAAPPCA